MDADYAIARMINWVPIGNRDWLGNGFVQEHDYMSSISDRSSSFVLPSLFGDDPEARPLYPQQTSDRRQSVDRISV